METIRLLLVLCNFSPAGVAMDCHASSYINNQTNIKECKAKLDEYIGEHVAGEKGKIVTWGICSPVGAPT